MLALPLSVSLAKPLHVHSDLIEPLRPEAVSYRSARFSPVCRRDRQAVATDHDNARESPGLRQS